MSNYIILNSWDGQNEEQAATRLAMMFRMEIQQAGTIVKRLLDGNPWQFEKTISDRKAEVAENYLRSMGFDVERSQAESRPEPLPIDDSIVEMSASETPGEENLPKEEGIENTESVTPSPPGMPFKKMKVQFHGEGLELAKVMIVNWILTVFTFGIYYFWGKTKVRRYLFEETSFAGDRFSYHGTGKELFKGWLFFVFMVAVVVALLAAVNNWLGPAMGQLMETLLTIIFIVGLPALMVGAYRYRLSRSSWRGIRFSFRGTRKEAVWINFKGMLLSFLTLGLYSPFFQMKMAKFWNGNSYFGNKSFKFTGEGKEIFKKFLIAIPLTILTAGIYFVWYKAYLTRYTWSKTHFAGGTFKFTATGWQFYKLYIVNLLLLIVTLGLAFPWIMVRNQKFIAEHLTMEGNVNLDKVIQEIQKSGAIGEGALDMFDVQMDIF